RLELVNNELELNKAILNYNSYFSGYLRFSSTFIEFQHLCQLQLDLEDEQIKLEVLVLPFNIEINQIPNLKKFIKQNKHLKHLEIAKNCKIEKQKDCEREIFELCKDRDIKCVLNYEDISSEIEEDYWKMRFIYTDRTWFFTHHVEIGQISAHDQDKADCLIIMGTSLRIPGVKALIKDFAKAVHERKGYVILVNATNVVTKEWNKIIYYQIEGTCDEIIKYIRLSDGLKN
ncbi:2332_t:CDS:2, partial [Gigaspora margarita]